MKITLEQQDTNDLEIIIRGNLSNPKISDIIAAVNKTEGLSKLFLYDGEKEYLCCVEDIQYFQSEGNHVYAITDSKKLETKHKLYELSDCLYSKGFFQISKSTIVNTAMVAAVEAEFSGNYLAILKNKTKLVISRKYIKDFRKYVMEEST